MNGKMEYGKQQCEFCGKVTIRLCATSFHGLYCEDCMRIENSQNYDAIREIKAEGKARRLEREAKKVTRQ